MLERLFDLQQRVDHHGALRFHLGLVKYTESRETPNAEIAVLVGRIIASSP